MTSKIVLLVTTISFLFLSGCGDAKEPEAPQPEPQAAAPEPQAAAPKLQEPIDAVTPEDIEQMKSNAARIAATQITPDNVAQTADALEKEIDKDLE